MDKMRIMKLSTALIIFILITFTGHAKVTPNSFFADNMLLQRDMEVCVWGIGQPGEKVTVYIAGNRISGIVGENGKWRVMLPTMRAGGPYELKINELTFKNVLIGELWLASGQSNMWVPVIRCVNAQKEIAAAKYPCLRFYKMDRTPNTVPQNSCKGVWEVCTPESVKMFPGVAYFFGRDLLKKLDVPVGVIRCVYGGTDITQWMSQEKLASIPNCPDYLAIYERRQKKVLEKIEEYKSKKQEPPKNLRPKPHRRPHAEFNGMACPLLPAVFRGVIWYQGEADKWQGYFYRVLLTALIDDWRKQWKRPDMPFIFVQLPNYNLFYKVLSPLCLAELRESQEYVWRNTKNTGMAVTIDTGDGAVHPKTKRQVGQRLAAIALRNVYGMKNVPAYGPFYRRMKKENQSIRIFFDKADGLFFKNNESTGFEIAGKDKKFVPANAVISGNTVIVSSPGVKDPVAVRYGWTDNPKCRLYDKNRLPAAPFRTDDWPRMSEK